MPPRLALSIRQPYAELILRGVKTIEYRSRPVGPKLIGQRFYIYASRKWGLTSRDCEGAGLPAVLIEPTPLPDGRGSLQHSLPTGVIVGTAVISHVTPRPPAPPRATSQINGGTGPTAYEWHLTSVRRFKKPRRPKRQPQPVWFRPF